MTCPACDGIGTTMTGNPNDPRSSSVTCWECAGSGSSDPATVHRAASDNGCVCPLAVSDCPECTASALGAGIPPSVVRGETKLTDHFDRETIALLSK